MKKKLLLLWFCFSAAGIAFAIYKTGDEFFSKKELLKSGAIILAGVPVFIYLLNHISGKRLLNALLFSLCISSICSLWLENSQPLLIIPQEEVLIGLPSTHNGEISLTWAYWSKPDSLINDEVDDWFPVMDISTTALQFQGDWQTEGKTKTCKDSCSIRMKSGISFHRPVFCIEGTIPVDIYKNDEVYNLQPGIPLQFFSSDSGLSRQLIFAISFFCIWGVLNLPAIALFSILPWKQISIHFSPNADLLIYTAAFLIPILMLGIIYFILKLWPFGEKTFLLTDMQVQYADYLIYLKQILRGERSLFYSFSKSIGDDFLGLYAYYLGNPLNWITALFPIEKFPIAINIIVLARYGFCGLTSAVYFRKVFRIKGETLIFSTAYALIALHFVIAEHIQLRDGAILLPLVLLGLESMIRRDRPWLYITSLAASLLISYYSAYQICFYCVLYFLFRTIMEGKLSWKLLFRFIGASLLSAGLCAVFLIPVAIQLTKGMKTFDLSQFTFTLNMRFSELAGKLFNSAFDMDQTLTSGFPNIFCGLFITTGLPLFFLNTQIGRKEKLLNAGMLVLFIAAMQIRALNLILHGFNEPVWWPYRYSFIICLFMITLVLRCYQERAGLSLMAIGISALLVSALLTYLHAQNYSWFTEDTFYLNLILTFCMFISWISAARSKEQLRFLIFLLSGLDLFLNGRMILAEKTAYQRSETVSDFQQYFEDNQPVINALCEYDNGFYRTEKTYYRDANDAMSLGYNGISHYSSTLNYNIMQFLPKMGYRYYPWRFLYGEGSDLAADSLLGVRYLISNIPAISKPYEMVFTEHGKTVFRNPFNLPIAFIGKNIQITDKEAITFQLQNDIFAALTGNSEPIYISASMNTASEQSMMIQKESCYSQITLKEKPAVLNLSVTPMIDGKLYLYIQNDSAESDPLEIYVNGTYLSDYFDGKGIPILPLINGKAGQETEIRIVPTGNRFCFDEIQVFSEDTAVLEKNVQTLASSNLSLRKYSETSVSGEVFAETEGYLFFSIPYDRGWKVFIDEAEVPAEKAFDLFLCAPVSAGRHTWTIHYQAEGLIPGAVITAAAILFLLAANYISSRRKKAEVM